MNSHYKRTVLEMTLVPLFHGCIYCYYRYSCVSYEVSNLPTCDCCIGLEEVIHDQQECCNKMEDFGFYMPYVRGSEGKWSVNGVLIAAIIGQGSSPHSQTIYTSTWCCKRERARSLRWFGSSRHNDCYSYYYSLQHVFFAFSRK
jgi:hypothetical protein